MRAIRFSLFIFTLIFLSNKTLAQEKIIEAVKIQGCKKNDINFIRSIVKVKKGEKLDSLALQNDIKRLKRLPAVSHAYYQVFHSHENNYNVFYNIEENFTIIPSLNVYTTNQDEFAYRIGINEFNLFGRNISFGGYYQKDIYGSYGINFRAPYLFSRQFGLTLNHQNLTSEEPVFINGDAANYKYNNTSYEALGLYEINFKNRIEAGINLFKETYEYRSGATAPNVPQNLEVNKILFKGIYEYNNLDYQFQYVEGFRSVFNFQYVTASDNTLPNFAIGWNDFLYYKRIGKRGNWANRLRLGLSTNNDSPFAPFSVDSNINVRGVGNIIDRGTAVIVLNTEYRHTLIDKNWFVLQSNVFIDAGSWRSPGGKFSDLVDSNSIRIYPGAGLRIMHKKIYNAVFRIDYGYGVTKNATRGLVFGIRQYF